MHTVTVRTANGDRAVSIHDGAEADARSIFGLEEYNIRKIWFQKVATIIDVGAHIGLFTILMKMTFPQATVHCFEPLPINISLLRKNLSGDGNIHINEYGLSSYRHSAEIWLSPAFGHGAASTHKTRDHSDVSQPANFRVAAEELQAIDGDISILKIDTEGHELRILRNIAPHFDRIETIFLEVHSGLALENILSLLRQKFIAVHFAGGMGNRYKVLFASKSAIALEKIRADIAPEIYYD